MLQFCNYMGSSGDPWAAAFCAVLQRNSMPAPSEEDDSARSPSDAFPRVDSAEAQPRCATDPRAEASQPPAKRRRRSLAVEQHVSAESMLASAQPDIVDTVVAAHPAVQRGCSDGDVVRLLAGIPHAAHFAACRKLLAQPDSVCMLPLGHALCGTLASFLPRLPAVRVVHITCSRFAEASDAGSQAAGAQLAAIAPHLGRMTQLRALRALADSSYCESATALLLAQLPKLPCLGKLAVGECYASGGLARVATLTQLTQVHCNANLECRQGLCAQLRAFTGLRELSVTNMIPTRFSEDGVSGKALASSLQELSQLRCLSLDVRYTVNLPVSALASAVCGMTDLTKLVLCCKYGVLYALAEAAEYALEALQFVQCLHVQFRSASGSSRSVRRQREALMATLPACVQLVELGLAGASFDFLPACTAHLSRLTALRFARVCEPESLKLESALSDSSAEMLAQALGHMPQLQVRRGVRSDDDAV